MADSLYAAEGNPEHQPNGLPMNIDNWIYDEDIADIISYVTSAFSDVPERLKTEEIQELRNVKSKSGSEYTEEELIEYPKRSKKKMSWLVNLSWSFKLIRS